MTKRLLILHVCCGPCATTVFEVLRPDYKIRAFFYNPNIHPEEEYLRRLEAFRILCKEVDITCIEGEYEVFKWFESIKGHEGEPEGGKRCNICFRFRLNATASLAAGLGADYFTTTHTVSPHKDASGINHIGRELSSQYGIDFLEADFKKNNGFKKSVDLSRDLGLYRQHYCGCVFSFRMSSR